MKLDGRLTRVALMPHAKELIGIWLEQTREVGCSDIIAFGWTRLRY